MCCVTVPCALSSKFAFILWHPKHGIDLPDIPVFTRCARFVTSLHDVFCLTQDYIAYCRIHSKKYSQTGQCPTRHRIKTAAELLAEKALENKEQEGQNKKETETDLKADPIAGSAVPVTEQPKKAKSSKKNNKRNRMSTCTLNITLLIVLASHRRRVSVFGQPQSVSRKRALSGIPLFFLFYFLF